MLKNQIKWLFSDGVLIQRYKMLTTNRPEKMIKKYIQRRVLFMRKLFINLLGGESKAYQSPITKYVTLAPRPIAELL